MTATLDGSVELLDRALAYTRGQLATVDEGLLGRPTPCEAWTLRELLAHMEDALDAFTEAAVGAVEVHGHGDPAGRVTAIQQKACALLGAWTRPAPGDIVVGGLDLGTPVLVAAAALEVTVHGWDVGQGTGLGTPIPAELAGELLPVAHRLVLPTDRGIRFAAARPADADTPYDVKLLAFLGRT